MVTLKILFGYTVSYLINYTVFYIKYCNIVFFHCQKLSLIHWPFPTPLEVSTFGLTLLIVITCEFPHPGKVELSQVLLLLLHLQLVWQLSLAAGNWRRQAKCNYPIARNALGNVCGLDNATQLAVSKCESVWGCWLASVCVGICVWTLEQHTRNSIKCALNSATISIGLRSLKRQVKTRCTWENPM